MKAASPRCSSPHTGAVRIWCSSCCSGIELDIFEAATVGQLDRVRALVDRDNQLVHVFAPDGFPALALAAFTGQRPVIEFLLSRGAEVNAIAQNPTRYTALTGAVAAGHRDIAELLLDRGAQVNYRYGNGYTPLVVAAANGSAEIVGLLLRHGADVNAKTDDGHTPLGMAVERGHTAVADLLRQRGATE